MTHEEYNDEIEKAVGWFQQIPNVTDGMVEAFVEEGFLSFDDLTFVEPAELAELCGFTEDDAEEMIAFSEEAAERVEEEMRLAKQVEAETQPAEAVVASAPRPSGSPRAEDLFPPEERAAAEPARPTFESIFGPDTEPKQQEEKLRADEVFGEHAPAAAEEEQATPPNNPE